MTVTADDMRVLAQPIAARHDVDLVDVVLRGSGPRWHVRVVVDRKGGVDLATCRAVSQDVSATLDEHDPIPGRFTLEVSSPGVDFPLRDRAAFARVEGRAVVVVHQDPETGRERTDRGTVQAAEAEHVVLDVQGAPRRIGYAAITRATQALPW